MNEKAIEEYMAAAAGRMLDVLLGRRSEILACDYWDTIREHRGSRKPPVFFGKERVPDEFAYAPTGLALHMQPVVTRMYGWTLEVSAYNLAEAWKMSRTLAVGTRDEVLAKLQDEDVRRELVKDLIHLNKQMLHPYEYHSITAMKVDNVVVLPGRRTRQEMLDKLSFENWTKLSVKGKVEVLNDLEKKIADIEHRTAAEIRAEQLAPNLYGYQHEGGIAINEELLIKRKKDTVYKINKILKDTYKDFSRKCNICGKDKQFKNYQNKGGSNKNKNENSSLTLAEKTKLIESIREQPNEGLTQLGARLYYYQPVEIDARQFAADTMSVYRNKFNA